MRSALINDLQDTTWPDPTIRPGNMVKGAKVEFGPFLSVDEALTDYIEPCFLKFPVPEEFSAALKRNYDPEAS